MGPCLSTPPSAPFEPPFDPGECTAETDLAVLESWRDSQPKSKLAEWWPKDKDKSQWQRVKFDGAGRVVVVGVHIGGITGVIPADLGLLTELHNLDLHANAFEGPVPKQLGQLTKLQRLTLGGPGGHGLMTSLPKELGKCKDLYHLRFADTQLKEFPNELGELPKLKRLELSNCRELVRLPYVNFPELEHLDISGCDKLVALPEGLVSCHKLKTLNFEKCTRLTGVPPGLAKFEEAPKDAPAAAAAPKAAAAAAKARRVAVPMNAVPKNAPAQAPGAITPLTNLPDEADALETGCLRVLGVWHRPGEPADGKFFRFDATRLGKMLVSRFGEAHFRSLSAESQPDKLNHSRLAKFTGDAERDEARGDVKSGKGAVLRCVNKRSGKASAVLLFDVAMGEDIEFGGVGCWNPPALAAADDFKQGDVLLFPDLVVEDKRFPALVPNSVAANTGTGWNRPAGDARFGRCGLVGDYWKALELEFTFDKDTLVAGLYTDAPTTDEMPLEVAVLRGDADAGAAENWQKIETKTVGSARVFAAEPVSCRRVRARWATTDLHKLGGLNTARSGGGIHAHPVGPAAAPAAAAAPRRRVAAAAPRRRVAAAAPRAAEMDLAFLESWRDSQPQSKLAEWWPKDKDPGTWQRVKFDRAGRVFHLDVNRGQITGEVPADLGLLTELRVAHLYYNEFEGPVPKQLGQLTNLQVLTMGAPGMTSLPKELANCKDLWKLQMNNCKLTEFPKELCKLSNLRELELNINRELVRLPFEFGFDFPELEHLNISSCDKLVALPEGLVSCHKLKTLIFNNCPRLTGVPPRLGELKKHCEFRHDKGLKIEEAPAEAPAAAAAPRAAARRTAAAAPRPKP